MHVSVDKPELQFLTLPNGMEVAHLWEAETRFLFADHFERQVSFLHGVQLRDNDCVVDVGANIGMFSLAVHARCRNLRIYAFEPAPPLLPLLRHNLQTHGADAEVVDVGLASIEDVLELTYYPRTSGMSSFRGNLTEDRAHLRSLVESQLAARTGGDQVEPEHIDVLVDFRLAAEYFKCRVRPLSFVMRERNIAQIDLLKIDVEKSELDVLRGIDDSDWPRIRQVVIEGHDVDDHIRDIGTLLDQHGFRISVKQETSRLDTAVRHIYAVRNT